MRDPNRDFQFWNATEGSGGSRIPSSVGGTSGNRPRSSHAPRDVVAIELASALAHGAVIVVLDLAKPQFLNEEFDIIIGFPKGIETNSIIRQTSVAVFCVTYSNGVVS
jgi:hypothetical protein